MSPGGRPRIPIPDRADWPDALERLAQLDELAEWGIMRLRYEAIMRLREEGWSGYRIARALGVSTRRVDYWIERGSTCPTWPVLGIA